MAILLVTYDLKAPGRNYDPVHTYLKKFTYCKGLESVWLLDTKLTAAQVRDALKPLVDGNDKVFVTKLAANSWASISYGCGGWLNEDARDWS